MVVRISISQKLLALFSFVVLLLVPAWAQESPGAGSKLLPERVGDFRAQGGARVEPLELENLAPEDFALVSDGASVRVYADAHAQRFNVRVVRTESVPASYSLLRYFNHGSTQPMRVEMLGDAGVVGSLAPRRARFIKNANYVEVENANPRSDETALRSFVKALAAAMEGDAGEPPSLVQHLPDEEKVNESTFYAVSLPALKRGVGERPVLEAISFEGGAEAVAAKYGPSQLVIIEFTTPQYAADADARINERIAQLRASGAPVPSGYRRIGNYSVFVFDAPDAALSEQLLSGVKYDKDVRWLGDNPRAYERARQAYGNTMGGVILATLKVTGLAILLCLGVGGLFGGAVFIYRRSQQGAAEAYSDAGGMMRLNLEDFNAPGSASNLLAGKKE